MPLLRHVMIKDVQLPDLFYGKSDLIMEDLQTLSRVCNFKCSEGVIKKIPNIKTLKLKYQISSGETEFLNFGLNNLGHLQELQSLNIFIDRTDGEIFQQYLVQNLSLPHSLKKLTLSGTMLKWEKCTTKIGSLPLLEYLKLDWNTCCGAEWETIEGQFCSLKALIIDRCFDLRYWITDGTHFPRLERVLLRFLIELEEIPSSIGDIPTLKSIRLDGCSTSAADSATRIQEEQLDLGNMDLHVILLGDAISYVKEIRDTFQYQREKYDKFLDVLKDFKAKRINTYGVIDTVKLLFKGQPNLILGFNIFLPEGYEITLDDEEEEQLELENMNFHLTVNKKIPFNVALSFIREVKGTLQYQGEKYDRFLDVMKDFKGQRIDTNGVIGTLKLLFKGHPNLIPGFNKFLPEGYEITLDDEEGAPLVS
ncbi:hypothetical protein ACS0TY_000193 [Phlomoides rotata]